MKKKLSEFEYWSQSVALLCFLFSKIVWSSLIKIEQFQTNIWRRFIWRNIRSYYFYAVTTFFTLVKQEGKTRIKKRHPWSCFEFSTFLLTNWQILRIDRLKDTTTLGVSKESSLTLACLVKQLPTNSWNPCSDHNPYKYNKALFNKQSIDRLVLYIT